MDNILEQIRIERKKQIAKWGEQKHDVTGFMAILAEEFGEAAKEAVDLRFDNLQKPPQFSWAKYEMNEARLRKELIQTAAVAVQMIEMMDKGLFFQQKEEQLKQE